jgi:hypothetical protein
LSTQVKEESASEVSDYKVGQHIMVKLSGGRLVEAEIKAVVETTEGERLQVSSGNETARIYLGRLLRSCDRSWWRRPGSNIPTACVGRSELVWFASQTGSEVVLSNLARSFLNLSHLLHHNSICP